MPSALNNNRFLPRAQPSTGSGDSPWNENGGVVALDNLAWDVVVGANSMVAGERLRVAGDTRVEGKLTVTGVIDPTAVIIADGAANSGYLELADGDLAPVSPLASFRLRWNQSLLRAEISENAGPWIPLVGGAAPPTALVSSTYTCPSSVAIGHAVYISGAGAVDLADADNLSRVPCVGVVVAKPTVTSCIVQYYGELPGFVGLTPGDTVYLSKTPGGVTQTAPSAIGDLVQRIGFARSSTVVVLQVTQETTTLQ